MGMLSTSRITAGGTPLQMSSPQLWNHRISTDQMESIFSTHPELNVNCQYWINPTPAILERLLPGVQNSGLIPLWVLPDENRFSADALEGVVSAVAGLRCAVWRLSTAGRSSAHECAQFGAFVKYPELIDGFLARSEVRYSELVKSLEFRNAISLYADVAWLACGEWELFSQFTAELRFGQDGAMAFLPEATAEAQKMGEHCRRLSLAGAKLFLH